MWHESLNGLAARITCLLDSVADKRFKTGTGRFDTRVYKLFEAFQSFEDLVFRLDERMSASPYKHSTAHVLHQLGLIESPEAHLIARICVGRMRQRG